MDSREVAKQYYDRIGGGGLAEQASEDQTVDELETICSLLVAGARVLDAGCGYGRHSIPLSQAGFRVTGVDASSEMLSDARHRAALAGADAVFLEGDLRSLPLPDASFDAVICLWSSFNSLLSREDQVRALAEMHRVLAPGGVVLIDLPDGDGERWTLRLKGSGPDGHLVPEYFVGGGNTIYLHTAETMQSLLDDAAFGRFEVVRERFGGRRRLLVRCWR